MSPESEASPHLSHRERGSARRRLSSGPQNCRAASARPIPSVLRCRDALLLNTGPRRKHSGPSSPAADKWSCANFNISVAAPRARVLVSITGGNASRLYEHAPWPVAIFCRSTRRWNQTHYPVSPENRPELSTIGHVALSRLRSALRRSKSILSSSRQSRRIAQNGLCAELDQFQQFWGTPLHVRTSSAIGMRCNDARGLCAAAGCLR